MLKTQEFENYMFISGKKQKEYLDELRISKISNEKLNNNVIELKHTNTLVKMETDIIGHKLNILNNSIKTLGEGKEIQSRMEIKISDIRGHVEELQNTLETFKKENSNLLNERDNLRIKMKTMSISNTKTIEEKKNYINSIKAEVDLLK